MGLSLAAVRWVPLKHLLCFPLFCVCSSPLPTGWSPTRAGASATRLGAWRAGVLNCRLCLLAVRLLKLRTSTSCRVATATPPEIFKEADASGQVRMFLEARETDRKLRDEPRALSGLEPHHGS